MDLSQESPKAKDTLARLNFDLTRLVSNPSASRGIVLSSAPRLLSTNTGCLKRVKREHRLLQAPGHLQTSQHSHWGFEGPWSLSLVTSIELWPLMFTKIFSPVLGLRVSIHNVQCHLPHLRLTQVSYLQLVFILLRLSLLSLNSTTSITSVFF